MATYRAVQGVTPEGLGFVAVHKAERPVADPCHAIIFVFFWLGYRWATRPRSAARASERLTTPTVAMAATPFPNALRDRHDVTGHLGPGAGHAYCAAAEVRRSRLPLVGGGRRRRRLERQHGDGDGCSSGPSELRFPHVGAAQGEKRIGRGRGDD